MSKQDKQAKMERAGVSLVIGDILIATCSREADGFGSPYGLDERITKADEIARRWNSHDALVKACEEMVECSSHTDCTQCPINCDGQSNEPIAKAKAALELAKKGA